MIMHPYNAIIYSLPIIASRINFENFIMKMSFVKLPNDLCNASCVTSIEFCSASIVSSLLWKYKQLLIAG